MSSDTTILWLRRDLRRHDLPALLQASEAADGGRVLPLFVLDEQLLRHSSVRTHALLQALRGLNDAYDGALVIRSGDPREVIPRIAREVGARSVHISGETTPYGRRRDEAVRTRLREELGDVPLEATGTPYAVGPGSVRTQQGGPYRVFTPFARAWREHGWPDPAPEPEGLRWHRQLESEELPALPQLPEGVHVPTVTEEAAQRRWQHFLGSVERYDADRDFPGVDGTSRMSVHLKYGTVHPRTLLADLRGRSDSGAQSLINELAWREFYADVLWHNPASAWADLNESLRSMPYDDPDSDPDVAAAVQAWREGRTGYPIVDAGMRQLLTHGWMHNRVRMITASFLAKHLHVWWPVGAAHFMEHLIDGDIASNNHGWQWVAGTGTDAAPYFRVFNPTRQGQRFDPDGDYVRAYVPELAHLSGGAVHEPWKARDGYAHGYPEPIVEHKAARAEALQRYEQARSAT